MPKQKITKDMVLDAAFTIAREQGMEQVLVKNLAEKLNCSTQPIYSYMKNMDDIRHAVEQRTNRFLEAYIRKHIDPDDLLRSFWNAHITFAREEPHLFRVFIYQRWEGLQKLDDLIPSGSGVELYISRQLQISTAQVRQLHLNMLIATVGLGALCTSVDGGISPEEMARRQELCYNAFLDQARSSRASD